MYKSKYIEYKNWFLLRLTGLFAQTACSAVWVPQNTSRRKRLCGILLHHIFTVAGTLRVPLSQLQKRHI
jgi:hypothetical protein